MRTIKYIGLTIGPIYQTIQKAEKTREIWAGSYLFSYLMKQLILEMPDALKAQIILPNIALLEQKQSGVGLYPDRLLMKGDENTFPTLQTIVTKVKNDLATAILKGIKDYSGYDPYCYLFKKRILATEDSSSAIKEFLATYFRVYFLETALSDLQIKDKDGNSIGLVKSLNFYLDNLELRPNLAYYDPDPIKVFMRAVNHSFLLEDAFHKDKKHFNSLIEIATTELRFIQEANQFPFRSTYDRLVRQSLRKAGYQLKVATKEEAAITTYLDNPEELGEKVIREKYIKQIGKDSPEDKMEEDLLDELFNVKGVDSYLRAYHKYVAIVHADGDKIGNLVGSFGFETKQVKDFSKDLLEFAKKANETIAGKRYTGNSNDNWGYGGTPVYIGGDDLVFFAPVASRNKDGKFETIFDLVAAIDQDFNDIFNAKDSEGNFLKYNNISSEDRPCLSYGISITYLKYPLQEAMKLSRELLEGVKKDTPEFKSRNRVNFTLLKHSRQEINGIINKNYPELLNGIRALLANTLNLESDSGLKFVNSLTFKLDLYQEDFFICVLDEERLEAFFENTFNEPFHEQNEDFLKAIRLLMHDFFRLQCVDENGQLKREAALKTLKSFYALLRFMHFIQQKNQEEYAYI